MEKDLIKILDFFNLPDDNNSVVLPSKLYLNDRTNDNEHQYKSIKMKYPVQVTNMGITLICTGGMANVRIDLDEQTMVRGTMCSITPGHFFQILQTSSDFDGVVFAVMRDFVEPVGDVKTIMKFARTNVKTSFFQMKEEDLQEFLCLYKMMKHKLSLPDYGYKSEIAKNYLSIIKFNIIQCITEQSRDKINVRPISRKDEIFYNFMSEVEKNYKTERNVIFYADKLCISPKYLSSVIHEVSRKYATEWIDGFVVLEAKSLLKTKNCTIKEICNMLNFANQSFFAKYFKQHTGYTPREFRFLE